MAWWYLFSQRCTSMRKSEFISLWGGFTPLKSIKWPVSKKRPNSLVRARLRCLSMTTYLPSLRFSSQKRFSGGMGNSTSSSTLKFKSECRCWCIITLGAWRNLANTADALTPGLTALQLETSSKICFFL